MSDEPSDHVDESGGPCSIHAPVRPGVMLTFALSGSRTSGFNHDLASKLQGLLMTLEDLVERLGARGEEELGRAAADAFTGARDIVGLVTESRALARAPSPTRRSLREIVKASCERAGVELATELLDVELDVSAAHLVHAISLAIEVAAGPGRSRPLESSCRMVDGRIEIAMSAAKKTTSFASEYLALAAATLRRDGGDLRCGDDRIVLWLQPTRPAALDEG